MIFRFPELPSTAPWFMRLVRTNWELVNWIRVILETQWPWPYGVHLKHTENGRVLIDQSYMVGGMALRRLLWENVLSIDEIHMAMFGLAENEYLALRVAGVR